MERLTHSLDIARRTSWVTRVLLRLFARRLNRELFAPVILRAKERGKINSAQTHELLAEFDPTQVGVVSYVTSARSRQLLNTS